MTRIIKVTDRADESISFYTDMLAYFKHFYSKEKYNEAAVTNETDIEKRKYFIEQFGDERLDEFDLFWKSYEDAIQVWWNTFKIEAGRAKRSDGTLIFEWFNQIFEPIKVEEN